MEVKFTLKAETVFNWFMSILLMAFGTIAIAFFATALYKYIYA